MGTKSKFFRAFVEGQTISDGRKIEADWIDQIVETFNVDTYTPRINVEHLSGYSPEPPFNGYGSVVAVRAQTDDITIDGKVEKRKALYCQVDANDQLVALVAANQKPYPSVELTPAYAGIPKVGLIGLAFTDKPASIATQSLQFSRTSPGTLFAASAEGVPVEFEAKPEPDAATKAFAAMTGFFTKLTGGTPAPAAPAAPAPPTTTTPPPANDNFAQLQEGLGLMAASITALGTKIDTDVGAIRTEFGALKTQLATTPEPSTFSRQPSTGGGNGVLTDC